MNPSAMITPRATGSSGAEMRSSQPNTPRGGGERMTPRGDRATLSGSGDHTPTMHLPPSPPMHSGASGRGHPTLKMQVQRATSEVYESSQKQTTPRFAAIPTQPLLSQSHGVRNTRGELPDAVFSKSFTHAQRATPVANVLEARAQSSTSASSRTSSRLQMDKLQFHGSDPQIDNDVDEVVLYLPERSVFLRDWTPLMKACCR